jgi:translocation and assembly module TamB
MQLQGGSRPFHVKGPLSGGSLATVLKGLDAELGIELRAADAFGLQLGPAPVVLRCKDGAVTIDPIQTSLNDGRVVLLPGLTVDDAKGIALTLAKGSAIDGAEINDEVSRRVLAYVAPVLDKATRVNGKVSVTVDSAEFPISTPDNRRTNLTGQLVFENVMFTPGPFATEVLSIAGQPNARGLALHEPVQLSVADGRVIQNGLVIPVSRDAKVGIDGSVGFDQTLDLRATVPITRAMLGAAAGLQGLVGDQKVVVPISGTVSNPRVNRRALQLALRELSRNVFKKELSGGANGLLKRLETAVDDPGGAGSNAAPAGIPADMKGLQDQLLRRFAPRSRSSAPAPPAPPAENPQ